MPKRFVFDPENKIGFVYENGKLITQSKFTGIKDGYLIFETFKIKIDRLDNINDILNVLFDPLVMFCVSRFVYRVDFDLDYSNGVFSIDRFDFPLDFVSDIVNLSGRIVRFDSDKNDVAFKAVYRLSSIDGSLSKVLIILIWIYNMDIINPLKFRFMTMINDLNRIGLPINEKKIDFDSVKLIKSRVLENEILTLRKPVMIPPYLLDISDFHITNDYLLFRNPELLVASDNIFLKNIYHKLTECISDIDSGCGCCVYDSLGFISKFCDTDLLSSDIRRAFMDVVIPYLREVGFRFVLMRF
ncbi:MAG: hypothetical protein QXD03_02185 [Candidatus Anstonellales archaeon]